MPINSLVPVVISTLLATGGAVPPAKPPAAPSTAPSTPVPATPPAVPTIVPGSIAPGPHVVDAKVEELLDALEHATDALKDFSASVAYEKFDAVTNGAVLQYGRLLYVKGAAGTPGTKLGVFFDEYVDAGGRKDDTLEQRFIFADGWLCEVDPKIKQFIKRQIVPPGQSFDPLKLGEGPIPLPIGQRKSEVLRRYIVSTPPMSDARLLQGLKPESVRPLRLVPMTAGAGQCADASDPNDFAQIDLFYDAETLLPVGVVATSPNGDRKTVKLSKLVRNGGMTADDQAMLSVETPSAKDWKIDVRPWKAADPAAGG